MAHEPAAHRRQEKLVSLVPSGFLYSDFSSSSVAAAATTASTQMHHGFDPSPDLFTQPPRDHRGHDPTTLWKGFFSTKPTTSNHNSTPPPKADFYQTGAFSSEANLMVAPDSSAWQANRLLVDDSSLRCLFPGVGGDLPNRGLSLSLADAKPSDVGLPPAFELTGEGSSYHQHHDVMRDGMSNIPRASLHQNQQQQLLIQGGRLFPSSSSSALHQQTSQVPLWNSKYLSPTQELLNEFCNLGSGNTSNGGHKKKIQSRWVEGGSSSSSSGLNPSLQSMDILELQKRKSRLLTMLEELDRRYRRYCEQMKAVVSSFEAVAGEGAAAAYSGLASKAMSRHFRCLRDGVVGQVRATRKAMGENNKEQEGDPAVVPGSTRGETPRLRVLDQCLRQQKAFQQAGMMESHPWRPQRGLPDRSVSLLRAWLFEHFLHPYPSDVDKHILARQTGLSRSQVSNWFINARVRLWKPMVEEMYLEEVKEQENQPSHGTLPGQEEDLRPNQNQDQNPNANNPQQLSLQEDQKPVQLLVNDTDSLSSIINSSSQKNIEQRDPNSSRNSSRQQQHQQQHQQQQQQQFASRTDNFGMVVDMDFSSSYASHPQNFGGGGRGSGNGGVSLTLGLQQHSGGGMSLSFSPASQNTLFFSRESMDNCQPVQFSILDGDAQNLPYRNLMGAQLLHDLAG